MRIQSRLRHLWKIAGQNLQRNALLSLATIVMMGLILFIFNVIVVLGALTQSSLKELGDKVDLIVYLSDDLSLYQATEMIDQLEAQPEVVEARFTTKDQALKEFLADYPEKADPFTEYQLENPLPANVHIVTQNPDQHEKVLDALKASPYGKFLANVESSNENQAIVNRLLQVTDFIQKLIFGVTLTFIFGSLFMILNAIHLSIFTRKQEVQIMQLVGADPAMIRLPFLIEGASYGFFAFFLSLTLLVFFIQGTQLQGLANFSTVWSPWLLLFVELLASIGVGIASSLLAINRYLKRGFILE